MPSGRDLEAVQQGGVSPAAMVKHFDRKKRRAIARMCQATLIDPKRWCQETGIALGRVDRNDASSMTSLWELILLRLQPAQIIELWEGELSEAIAGGVPRADASIPGDPFVVVLTGICKNQHPRSGRDDGEHWQYAMVKTGFRVDQAEGEKIVAHLKNQPNVNTCEVCLNKITIWQADNTRLSTFVAMDKSHLKAHGVEHAKWT